MLLKIAAMIIVIRIIAFTTVAIIDVFVAVPRESLELWLNSCTSVTVVEFALKASPSIFSSMKLPSSEMRNRRKIHKAVLNSVSIVILV